MIGSMDVEPIFIGSYIVAVIGEGGGGWECGCWTNYFGKIYWRHYQIHFGGWEGSCWNHFHVKIHCSSFLVQHSGYECVNQINCIQW